jgi:hypothetical protein
MIETNGMQQDDERTISLRRAMQCDRAHCRSSRKRLALHLPGTALASMALAPISSRMTPPFVDTCEDGHGPRRFPDLGMVMPPMSSLASSSGYTELQPGMWF